MSYQTPSSNTHVGFPTVAEQDEYEGKSEESWAMPQMPLRALNPTILSSDGTYSPRGFIATPLPLPMDPHLVQRWNSMVEAGDPSEHTTVQPAGIEAMSIGRHTSATLDSFYERAPNLQKLTKGQSTIDSHATQYLTP